MDLTAGGYPHRTYVGRETTVEDVRAFLRRVRAFVEDNGMQVHGEVNLCPTCDSNWEHAADCEQQALLRELDAAS